MPKLAAMANISRPFQIAFLGIVVLAGVWLFALHGGSSSTPSSSASSASAPASSPASAPHASASSATSSPSASTSAPAAGKGSSSSSSVYHGSAPGVEGLSRAVAKAHGAVTTSQQNAQQLEAKSAQASSSGSTPAATQAPAASASAPATAQSAPTHSATPAKPAAPTHATKTTTRTTVVATAGRQHQVEAQIAKGKVVLILFWNKQGSDDRAAKAAVESFAHGHARTAVVTAGAGEVAAFGTITRGVQVLGTPTIFVVGKSGKAIVLTGLTDSFALSQAIAQARHS